MADAIISAVVENLISMVLSSIKEEVKVVSGVNYEIKKIVSNFKSIQALLDDAEEQQVKEASVKNWLFDLKAVTYDMDDMLDEWKTWIYTSQLQHQHRTSDSNQNHLKHKDGANFMIHTPSDPVLFIALKDQNGELHIIDDMKHDLSNRILSSKNRIVWRPAIISAVDEETEFNALVEEGAALLELLMGER